MKIAYKVINFKSDSLKLLEIINTIVEEYLNQGYDLTLRQLYYQLVARGYIENNERSYKRIGNLVNDGRLAGMIDWNAVTDRTRNLRGFRHYSNPSDFLRKVSLNNYNKDHWEGQHHYVEVWIEKDALVGVLSNACQPIDVPYFSCRGYVSQSEMWQASQRFINRERDGQYTHIIHLGDHDPSGIDMTRDIQERLEMFGSSVEVHRVALTMEQIEELCPPPNPAKITDSRAHSYISKYGNESWELDALDPSYINRLVHTEVSKYCDLDLFKEQDSKMISEVQQLLGISENYDKIVRSTPYSEVEVPEFISDYFHFDL